MSITSRITSMTQHTKEAYDKIASLGADLTGVNKNLDNIADVLEGIYEDYPKVTGTGISITMDNTKKGGMEIEYKGNTSQTGTPTPTSPIDVNVVKGNNTIKVSGKNLLDLKDGTYTNNGITAVVNNGEITLNGTDSGNATNFLNIPLNTNVNWVQGENYTISLNNPVAIGESSGSPYCTFRINNGGQLDTRFNPINSVDTKIIDKNDMFTNMIAIRTNSGITYNNFKLKPQIELGSTATTYEPYQAPGNYPVNLRGKNLFNKNNANIENGGWISAVGVKGNSDNNKLFKLPIKPSTTYTIQKIAGNRFRAGTYQNGNIANGTSFNVFQQNDSGTSITITSTATDTYLYVQYLAGDTNEQQLLDSIQIEERFYSYYLSVILGI